PLVPSSPPWCERKDLSAFGPRETPQASRITVPTVPRSDRWTCGGLSVRAPTPRRPVGLRTTDRAGPDPSTGRSADSGYGDGRDRRPTLRPAADPGGVAGAGLVRRAPAGPTVA